MANNQNTIAGTANGGNLVTDVGNSFLNAIGSLSNIVATSAGAVGSMSESITAARLALQQAVNPPQQSTPQTQINSAADFYSDPARVQKALMIAGILSVVIFGGYYVIKKI